MCLAIFPNENLSGQRLEFMHVLHAQAAIHFFGVLSCVSGFVAVCVKNAVTIFLVKICLDCISSTIRCKKLILGRDIG